MNSKSCRRFYVLLVLAGLFLMAATPIASAIDHSVGTNPIRYYNPASGIQTSYFGFGWYNIGLTFGTSEMTEIATSGSQMILLSEVPDPRGMEPALVAKFDQAQSLGLKIVVATQRASGLLIGVNPSDPSTYQPLSALVNLLKNHPALLGWMIGDENELYSEVPLQDVIDTAQVIHALDPNHQVFQNFSSNSSQGTVLNYMNGTNVLGMDLYNAYDWTPEFGGCGTYLTKVQQFVATAVAQGYPYVQVTQGIGPDLGVLSSLRFPTAAEYRWSVFAPLASAGAREILNFTYGNSDGWYSDPSAFPNFRDNIVKPVFQELAGIKHAMETGYNVGTVNLAWSEPGWSETYNRISQLLLYDDEKNQYYLIVTNNGSDTKDVTVTVSNLPVGIPSLNALVSKTGETIAVTDLGGGSYRFTDTLGNHEVILYTLGEFSASSTIITTSSYGNWGANPAYYYNDVWNGVPLTSPNYRERVEFNADGIWQVQGLAIGDASNDGTRNVYTAKSCSGYATINEWDYVPGSGTLSNAKQMFLTLEPSVYKTRGIAVGNADNSPDGTQELLWLRQDEGNTYLFADDWNGTSLSNQRILAGPTGSPYVYYAVAVGDATNSGQNDILLAWGATDSYTVIDRYRWDGSTLAYQSRLWTTLEPNVYNITALTVGDANGDGQNEVLLSMGVPGAYWQVKSLSWNGSSWDWTDARPTQLWEGDNGMGTYISGLAVLPSASVGGDNGTLQVTPGYRTVTSSAGSTTFSVQNADGGSMGWTAAVVEGSGWLSIPSGGSGTDNGTITVSFTANTANSPRTGTIRVAAPGATGSPKDVTVTQGRNPALPLAAGQETLRGFSYGPWGVAIPGQTYFDVFNNLPFDGTTYRERIYATVEGVYATQGLATGGLENSGTNKVWQSTKTTGSIVLSENDYVRGTGALTNGRNVWVSLDPANYDTRGIAIGDADNDGIQELIWAQRAGNVEQVVAYTWDGTNLGYKGTLYSTSDGSRCYGVSVGDADNDGVNDVVLAWGVPDGPVTIYKSHWDGMTFSWGDTIFSRESGYKVLSVAVGDPDNDNVNEVLISWGYPTAYWIVDGLTWNGASWDSTRVSTEYVVDGQGYYTVALAIGNADNAPPYSTVDLARVLAAMDSKVGDPSYSPLADVDGDGEVTSTDLSIVLAGMN
ncbi:MAG: FG-GAP-like repeat-containing protein [Phycisphaerae bacterium]